MKYSIIDIETTGGNFRNGKITEIAIYVHDGKNVINEFVSLINPEQTIPPYITQLTGISNNMVSNAPKFYEVAKKIVEITEGSIFVAHNASFDYGFIQQEFRALGYEYKRDTLCTVKLSRKILPGYNSYSLGNLCEHLNINNDARHRASGDALATVTLFEILLANNNGLIMPLEGNKYFTAESLHPDLSINLINDLPERVGVYFFYNENKDLIYIGKSKNIKKRVLTHLGNVKAQKAIRMKSEVASVDFYITGSELVALLMESAEIKMYKPKYNKAQTKSKLNFGFYSFKDRKGYIRFNILKNDGRTTPLSSFESIKEAKQYLNNQSEKFELCQKLCGLSDSVGSCFQYQIKICKGACIDLESFDLYNIRAQKFIDSMTFSQSNCIIKDVGRSEDESAVIVIKNGKYIGYGWIDKYQNINSLDQILDIITIKDDTMDARLIIKRQIQENKKLKVIKLSDD